MALEGVNLLLATQHAERSFTARAVTVLLVEDESVIRMNVSDYLRDRGFDVLEAADAAEAIIALCNPAHDIDVVFSDVRMPGQMDGFGLASWVEENCGGLPVVLTSGDIGTGKISYKRLTPDRFLSKPYELGAVAATLSRAICVSIDA